MWHVPPQPLCYLYSLYHMSWLIFLTALPEPLHHLLLPSLPSLCDDPSSVYLSISPEYLSVSPCLKSLQYILCNATFLLLLCKVPVANGRINNNNKDDNAGTGYVMPNVLMRHVLAGPFSSPKKKKAPSILGPIKQAGIWPGGEGEYISLPNSLMEEELH